MHCSSYRLVNEWKTVNSQAWKWRCKKLKILFKKEERIHAKEMKESKKNIRKVLLLIFDLLLHFQIYSESAE